MNTNTTTFTYQSGDDTSTELRCDDCGARFADAPAPTRDGEYVQCPDCGGRHAYAVLLGVEGGCRRLFMTFGWNLVGMDGFRAECGQPTVDPPWWAAAFCEEGEFSCAPFRGQDGLTILRYGGRQCLWGPESSLRLFAESYTKECLGDLGFEKAILKGEASPW